MAVSDGERSAEDAVALARACLVAEAGGRIAPEQILLGHYSAGPATEGRHLLAVEACLPSWCGANGGQVFARVLVPRRSSDGGCRIAWAVEADP